MKFEYCKRCLTMTPKKQKETWMVYATGRDCDGYASDEEYEFESKYEADRFASDCNAGSDGLQYKVHLQVEKPTCTICRH